MSGINPESELSQVTTPLLGTVLAVQANFYMVQLDFGLENTSENPGIFASGQPSNNPESKIVRLSVSALSLSKGHVEVQNPKLLCTRRTRLKKIGQQVMVGDRVLIEEPDWADGRGAISEVLPRKTQLDRPPVANAEQILLVFALADPPLEPYQLSRFLLKAESTELTICLCLNKSDLVPDEQLEAWRSRLNDWGYEPVFISIRTRHGLEQLSNQLNQKTTIVAGPSGVGKSSLINQLIPNVNLRVGEVSGKLSRGRHTTRHVELFDLPAGGLLADTPGFNQPDLDCSPEELALYFPEARQRLAADRCQFSNCLHRDEPNCAVRGEWERYEYYLVLLEEAIARATWVNQQADPESTMKAKTKGKGQTQYEPKLESKKYRRLSRRAQQQALQEVYQDAEE